MRYIKCLQFFLGLFACLVLPLGAYAATSFTLSSPSVLQGEPLLMHLYDLGTTSAIRSVTFNAKVVKPFVYQGSVAALFAVPLTMATGTYGVRVEMKDGTSVDQTFLVTKRNQPSAPLGIPLSLGGNTKASATKLVSTLQTDNASLSNLTTADHLLWSKPFAFPVKTPVVTDSYGYNRETVEYAIPHKGTDFRAPVGTPVFAMNAGVVRIAKKFRTYGKTVVIDHGLGVSTMYMHLSKIEVVQGQIIKQGTEIGLSGNTGYSEGSHLHVSVRIENVSVDPMAFLKLLGVATSTPQ